MACLKRLGAAKAEVGELEFCESCVLGKAHKLSFPKAKHTTKGIMEYIHSDLWGSPSTQIKGSSVCELTTVWNFAIICLMISATDPESNVTGPVLLTLRLYTDRPHLGLMLMRLLLLLLKVEMSLLKMTVIQTPRMIQMKKG
uniref:Putative mitochondrial protein n=1 Tax=Noccaea caerulescens TaxID=107243 RepID=A0A1J3FE12_NOCCA